MRQELSEITALDGEELIKNKEITTDELRERVLVHLRKAFGPEVAQRYETPARSPETILVKHTGNQVTPFSRGRHRRQLESCGLSADDSAAVTAKIHRQLVDQGRSEVSSREVVELTYHHLDQELGPSVAQRYLTWVNFRNSDRPLLILIGGTAGSGKSTVATEVANLLEIVRTQSTDLLREVMRTMIPERIVPALHSSSFTAWQTLPGHKEADKSDGLLADGYRAQAELLSIAIEAVIQRALKERVSLVLEGIHVSPWLLQKVPQDSDAIVVPIMLGTLKPAQLRNRLRGRGKQAPDRRAKYYLQNFDAIWRLQSFLLSEADRTRVPIITDEDKDKVIQKVMVTITDALTTSLSASRRK